MKVKYVEKPMKSIMKIGEWTGTVMYRAACDCGSEDHDMTIDIEFDTDIGMTVITFYKKVSYDPYWFGGSNDTKWMIFKAKSESWWKRIKAAVKLLTGGYLNYEATFSMYGEEQINDLMKALEYAREKSKEYEEELKKQGITQISG